MPLYSSFSEYRLYWRTDYVHFNDHLSLFSEFCLYGIQLSWLYAFDCKSQTEVEVWLEEGNVFRGHFRDLLR